jgi:hypothetical protein
VILGCETVVIAINDRGSICVKNCAFSQIDMKNVIIWVWCQGFRSDSAMVCCFSVLFTSQDSVMAMLEAFVHDPLINWRLLSATETAADVLIHQPDGAPQQPPPPAGVHPPPLHKP